MPACAEINSSMQQLTDIKYSTREQHKEAMSARVARDAKDTQELLKLPDISPFTDPVHLRRVKLSSHIHIQAENQVVAVHTKSVNTIQDEPVHVDPQVLFQMVVMVGTKNDELQDAFNHELCHYIFQLSLRLSTLFDQPQSPVCHMPYGGLRLKNFLVHLQQCSKFWMVAHLCNISPGPEEPDTTRSYTNTLRMSS